MNEFISKFTLETLEQARMDWLACAQSLDQPTINVERVFALSSTRLDYEELTGDSHSYGVFCRNNKECLAVVDIVRSSNDPQRKIIKMLDVVLCPRLYETLSNVEMSKLEEIIDVYYKATHGTIKLTYEHDAQEVKLYGRNDAMRVLLTSLKERITADPELPLTATWKGHFLTIEIPKEV